MSKTRANRTVRAIVAAVSVCFISSYVASAIVAPISQCELHTSDKASKCSASPLLVSALPPPEALTEKLLVHFAALSYACGLHATAAACANDTQHACVFGREGAGGNKCRVAPLALMQHSAAVLLCEDSHALSFLTCSMAADCKATAGCEPVRSGGCIPSWKVGMSDADAREWNKDFFTGKKDVWGVCPSHLVFRHMQKGCVADSEVECKAEAQCGWTQVGKGRAPLCTPVLGKVEAVLESRAGGAFQEKYKEALKLCRDLSASPSKCNANGSSTFTPNITALLAYSDLSTVTAPAAAATNITTSKHHHHHHPAAPATPTTPTTPTTPPPTPSEAASTPPTTGQIPHHHHTTLRHPGPPSPVSIAVLVLGSILCVAVIGGGAYSLYQRMQTPQTKYHPVMSDVEVLISKGPAAAIQMSHPRGPAP